MATEGPIGAQASTSLTNAIGNDCKRTPSGQETPELQLGSRLLDTKPRQGRLLFDTLSTTPPKEEAPVLMSNTPAKPLVLLLQTTPPTSQGQSCVILTAPNNTTPPKLQPHPVYNITTPTTKPLSAIPTLPSLPQSCPPKPKLTKDEREALRQERERARVELKVKREEERLIKQQEKLKKEQEKRERQLKREQEAKERHEKKAREEREKERKREKKEAEKKKLEEERKKVEEEKEQAKAEKLRIVQQNKDRFIGFFSRKPKEQMSKPTAKQDYAFITPFSLTTGMTLATRPRSPLKDTAEFDHLFRVQEFEPSLENCVKELKGNSLMMTAASKHGEEEDVVEVKPDDSKVKHHFKLLQFHKNHRPAYYGTWRKCSAHINPRNPFKRDETMLDYSVDSDDEWEEEDPGESITDSEGEGDISGGEEDEDEEDDGFFVPHGYLSDGEGDDELPAGFDPTGNTEDSESKKKKMADKAKAWEVEFARKCQPLKPVKIGCVWTSLSANGDNLSKDQSFLRQFAAVALVDLPLSVEATKKEQKEGEYLNGSTETTRMPVPDEAVPDLIRLIHGTSMGVSRIIKTFRIHWGTKVRAAQTTPSKDSESPKSPKSPNSLQDTSGLEAASGISKRQLERKIHEIVVKDSRAPTHRPMWHVHDAVLAKYGLDKEHLTPLTPLISPQSKGASDAPKAVTPLTPNLNENPAKKVNKRKPQGIKTLFEMFESKASDSQSNTPPKPKRVKLELHVDRLPSHTSQTNGTAQQTKVVELKPALQCTGTRLQPPGMESRPTPLAGATAQQTVVKLLHSLLLTQAQNKEKRELEDPVPQSAAKRLCLDDSTNKMEAKSTSDDKSKLGEEVKSQCDMIVLQ